MNRRETQIYYKIISFYVFRDFVFTASEDKGEKGDPFAFPFPG